MWFKKKMDFEKNLKPKLRKQLELKSHLTLFSNLPSKKTYSELMWDSEKNIINRSKFIV